MYCSVYIIFFFVCSVFGADEYEPKLRFYHDTIDNYTELSVDKASDIFYSSWYDSNKTTMIFCHGFTGYPKGSAVTAIIGTYLKQGRSNVALLNWDRLAAAIYNGVASSYFNWAVPNAIKLAATFAETLLSLSKAGMDLRKTHLIGHSLGAHVMGIAGYKIMERNGIILPWITGLDPAGVYFDRRRPWERLNPQSARFVDVIHSDPNKYGSSRSLGTVDFWPNFRVLGPVQQPGCEVQIQLDSNTTHILKDLCNHNRCWEFLLDAMKYPGTVMGSYAKSYRAWKGYNKEQKLATVLEIGKYEPNAVPGDYYFLTADASPYGLGEDGL